MHANVWFTINKLLKFEFEMWFTVRWEMFQLRLGEREKKMIFGDGVYHALYLTNNTYTFLLGLPVMTPLRPVISISLTLNFVSAIVY